MKKRWKVLILIHPDLNPLKWGLASSKSVDSPCKTESFVYSTLLKMGYEPEFLELESDIDPLVKRVNSKPKVDVVFNLLEELSGEARFDFHAVSYLESKGIPFTGNGPRALMLTRDKGLSKMVVEKAGALTPQGFLVRHESQLENLNWPYPSFLKLNSEDASFGIRQSNRTENIGQLRKLFRRLRKISGQPLLVEQFIPGVDLTVGVLGNQRLQILPARTLRMPSNDWVAGERVKFESQIRFQNKIRSRKWNWPSKRDEQDFMILAKKIYVCLGMRGYGRLDFRRTSEGKIYFLEANANPDLAKDEDFATSARSQKISYAQLLEKILKLGLKEQKRDSSSDTK